MKIKIMFFTVILACWFLFPVSTPTADFSTANIFIDIDGDGFNDNNRDDDKNGIPDRFEPGEVIKEKKVKSVLGDVFNAHATEIPDDLLSKSGNFGTRKFETRGLWQCHRGLSSEQFGPGNGIGLGAAACAGGVCGI